MNVGGGDIILILRMSRRREATDLARALELSTQSTTEPRSTPLLRDSSPPITPLPTKYMPQTPVHGVSAAGGFMEQYHQQLQQAQSYYQQNPGLLAPASHSARNPYAQATVISSRPAYPLAQQPSSAPKPLNFTSSKSTSHVSDSSRSIPGAVSLPDSGYNYPVTSRDLEPYPARRDFGLNTPSSSSIDKSGDSTGQPSSGIQTSTSGNTSANFAVPPAQPPRASLISSITTTSVSSNANLLTARSHIATSGTTGLPQRSPADSAHRPSMIRTAPIPTPLSLASRAQLLSDPLSTVPTYVSFVKTSAKDTSRQPASSRKMAVQNPRTVNAEDIVADSEGEEDGRDIVQGTQDDQAFGASNVMPSFNVGGLGAGLMTPPVTNSNTSALPVSSARAAAAVPSAKSAPLATTSTNSVVVQTSTRPKPRKKVKAPVDDAVTAAALPDRDSAIPLPVEVEQPAESLIKNTTTSIAEQENGQNNENSTKPLKTYGSKDKAVSASKKQRSEPARVVDLTSTQPPSPRVESSKRKGVQSKSRAIIDSESELSDTAVNSKSKRKNLPNTDRKADDQTVENEKQPLQELKGNGKKRAIITSDDEDEYVQEKTPDSKRRKPEGDKSRSNRTSPKKKVDTVRGSSIDPLDLNVDAGLSGKAGQMEVSVELSPSNYAEFGLANDNNANENGKIPVPTNVKSPNKVHFDDAAPVDEDEIAVTKAKAKQPKLKATKHGDAHDDEPEMYAAPANDEDDEDDFVPNGSKKSKAKAKTAKAKKTAPPKAKAAKGKKVSQAKGKNVKSVEIIDESSAIPQAAMVEIVPEISEPAAVSSTTLRTSMEEFAEPVEAIAEVSPTKLSTAKKGKAKKAAPAFKNKSESPKPVSDDEQPHNNVDAAQNDEDATSVGDPSKPETSAAFENDSAKHQTTSVEVKSTNLRKTAVVLSADESETEKQRNSDEAAENKVTTSKILQPKASVILNTTATVKIEPSFVVDKNGNVKEFRTCRTDLPKVVQTTGGVKRMGFSRRTAIPSLHKSIKLPPKRLPPPPKKPSRKKEDSDDDSDELDENGKKKIRPGDPEWYMMDVD
ncbi:hypothetical protein QFC21_004498 [Naganishia friedmannii]|uniref:Uncharacterized protein n=1 Tax=Naganishia friedmannii TaxID=89922 RepID=A0ACC2VFI7_9TREE|nr:hypothetical protein QFC21_004498 [Naganishia friedmannii]